MCLIRTFTCKMVLQYKCIIMYLYNRNQHNTKSSWNTTPTVIKWVSLSDDHMENKTNQTIKCEYQLLNYKFILILVSYSSILFF